MAAAESANFGAISYGPFWSGERVRDWQSSENALNRESQLILNTQNVDAQKETAQANRDAAEEAAWADAAAGVIAAGIGVYYS